MSEATITGNVARSTSPIEYRPDIDGLRAVAVMSVIFAHAGVKGIAGGFLGVDVFFVISGYLITAILRRELEANTYSLARFYERRARRIIPALIPVLVICFPLAMWLMLPEFRQNFGQSVVATLLFSNNLLLAKTSGYWDLESAFKPLLHTWSLGVEEQFYIFFPLLLMLVWRRGKDAQLAAILCLGVISFALSEYGWRHYPDLSFYLPTSRAWELMAGCAASYVVRRPRPFDAVFSTLALVAILASMVIFDERTPSPSYYSALPVLGSVGVILFSRKGTPAFRLLSLRPVVFIGLISYSAYLWHQPLFAFARVASLEEPGGWTMAGFTVLTLVLATVSWRFVENPFRNRRTIPIARFALMAVIACALLGTAGLVLHLKQGFPKATFPNVGKLEYLDIKRYNGRIHRLSADQFSENGNANLLVVGNSFGRDAANILIESGASAGKNLVYLPNYPACSPPGQPWDPKRAARLLPQADVVVVAIYYKQNVACLESIERALRSLTQAKIVYIGPKHYGNNINPYGRVPLDQRSTVLATVPRDVVHNNNAFKAMLPPDRYLDLLQLLGHDGKYLRFFDDAGNPLTPDREHLTRFGTLYISRRLDEEKPAAFEVIRNAEHTGKSE